ncbi:hypothetical protein Micbo1qcDRAFT_158991 [Microdochium bolleyi]|uniref:Uncharacterized protein n=1 Tax=Microdochium bolleyi TaxID=196109 RepID=A0A136JAF6_9PEZI|nr:hypothetical protein Micbo1qcDRAFT_158991 [Microdochium bolleyi]
MSVDFYLVAFSDDFTDGRTRGGEVWYFVSYALGISAHVVLFCPGMAQDRRMFGIGNTGVWVGQGFNEVVGIITVGRAQ